MEDSFGRMNINSHTGKCSYMDKTSVTSNCLDICNDRLNESADCADELRDSCGLMACVLSKDTPREALNVAHTVCTGLVALQHRGQEGAGIVTSDGKGTTSFKYHKGQGLISTIFNDENLVSLKGNLCLGHNRYCTAGGIDSINTQPFVVHTRHGPLAVAHNGQLINAAELRTTVLDRGVGLSTLSDSELLTQILCLTPPRGEQKGPDWASRIRHLMEASPTAYSLALMFEDKIYGVRDPFGNRPLCIGKLASFSGDSEDSTTGSKTLGWVLSSESCAFQSIGATYYKEVMPGEIVEISPRGVRTLDIVARPRMNKRALSPSLIEKEEDYNNHQNGFMGPLPAFCIFEYVYFARADSIFEGQQVYHVRERCGKQLAIEANIEADIVSSIPESATPAALGFSRQSCIPFTEVLCKNRYIGRSFLQPDTRSRCLAVSKKFGVLTQNIAGKRLILVDDSIVRGNTVRAIIRLLKDHGATEVHLRIASPPIKFPCYMGIDIPTKTELIANKKEPEKLAEYVGADSLVYLSINGLIEAVQAEATVKSGPVGHCTACLDSNYPCKVEW